jgi:hypothetical protein
LVEHIFFCFEDDECARNKSAPRSWSKKSIVLSFMTSIAERRRLFEEQAKAQAEASKGPQKPSGGSAPRPAASGAVAARAAAFSAPAPVKYFYFFFRKNIFIFVFSLHAKENSVI